MFFPWIKRLGAIGLVVLGGAQASAQYGSMAYYGADAGVTYGTPIATNSMGTWGYGTGQSTFSTPRSPGAGVGFLNGTGRYFGFGFSEGYHNCGTAGCAPCGQGSCLSGFGGMGLGGGCGIGCNAPNITAPSAPACNSCQSPIQNAPCGNQVFGNYQFHPGHVFGRPSYGNPHYPTDCINWREAVKYDRGPCVPHSVYQSGPAMTPSHVETHVVAPSVPTHYPHAQPRMQPQMVPQNVPQMVPTEASPSDGTPQAWPWQRGQAVAPQPAPRSLNEPTPAVPLTPVPSPQPRKAAPPPVLEPLPSPAATDDALLDTDMPEEDVAEPKLDLPENLNEPTPLPPVTPAPAPQPSPAPAAPVVPPPPAAEPKPVPAPATVPPAPAPAPVPAPAPAAEPKVEPAPASDDEDLLSNRRNPIRQPKRR